MVKRQKLEEENRERKIYRQKDEWDQAYDQGKMKKVKKRDEKAFTL